MSGTLCVTVRMEVLHTTLIDRCLLFSLRSWCLANTTLCWVTSTEGDDSREMVRCMCVCLSVCLRVTVCPSVCCLWLHVCLSLSVCVCVCVCVCVSVCMCACICMYNVCHMCLCVPVNEHVCIMCTWMSRSVSLVCVLCVHLWMCILPVSASLNVHISKQLCMCGCECMCVCVCVCVLCMCV